MPRKRIDQGDIVKLWNYLFGEESPPEIRSLAHRVAAAGAATSKQVFLRFGDEDHARRQYQDQLVEIGRGLMGTSNPFGTMYKDDFDVLTIDTNNRYQLSIIPFTVSNNVNDVDTVVAMYGKDLSYFTFLLTNLAQMGWEKLLETYLRNPQLPS